MNGSVTFKQYEIYFHTLNTELCRLCSFFFLLIPAKKMYLQISEKHDQTSINLSNLFNFIG